MTSETVTERDDLIDSFDKNLARLTENWSDDPMHARAAFQELINSLMRHELYMLVIKARIEYAERLCPIDDEIEMDMHRYSPFEAIEQYTLALHTALTQHFGRAPHLGYQLDLVRRIIWCIFVLQVYAELYVAAATTAELALTGFYHTQFVDGPPSSLGAMHGAPADIMEVARAIERDSNEAWASIRGMIRSFA